MRYSAFLFLIFIFSLTIFSQPRNPKVRQIKPPESGISDEKAVGKISQKKTPGKVSGEKAELEKAVNEPDAMARIAALRKFIESFPQSEEIVRAQELIVSARAQLGENALKAGDMANGIQYFKSAVKDAPQPLSEKLFADVILQFPTNLFLRGQRDAALEIAQLIEEKISGDAKQLVGLATFYISVENTANARRIAQKAVELAPEMPVAYQTLGIANRLSFRLDEAVTAYTKALELDPASVVSKRSLAEMKRANGKTDEAIKLYREVLDKDATDANAETGLVLALFESGKQTEAETKMSKLLAANGNNLPLLVGAAYFYAAHNEGAKAVDLAQKALAVEPRYTWANIALARGFLAQNKPFDAERVLLVARGYGNFPTIDYEIASARLQAGFYREAADELNKNFEVQNGMLTTYLGNRVGVDAEDFLKLLSLERRAAIFSYEAADTFENAERLKSLLEFSKELNNDSANETILSESADKFIKGDDKMKIHRQLFIAGRLLDKKKDLPKVIELTQSAIKGVDTALDVPNPSAAVMADELYETRTLAMSRGEVLIVPEVSRPTLSVILRGRIEELSGWTLYQQNKPDAAIVKLKRAVSVLPADSNWWRSSVWRLGAALEAEGKTKEALENYIKSYKSGESNTAKYIIIDSLYQKVNGNRDGLEEKIGKQPEGISDTVAKVTENINPEPEISPSPEVVTETSPTPLTEEPKQQEIQPTSTKETSKTETLNLDKSAQSESIATPTPEISPSPEPISTSEKPFEKTSEVSTMPMPETDVSSIPKPATEIKNSAVQTPQPSPTETPLKNNRLQNSETVAKVEKTSKPLFDPVIIEVRKSDNQKNNKLEEKLPPTKNISEENDATKINTEETNAIQPVKAEKNETKDSEAGATRPRVFIENNPRVVISDNLKAVETPKCELVTSQESIWLVNDGGSLSVLVGFAEKEITEKINAVSSSPTDIAVSLEPEIGANAGRSFFILKSISKKKGAFTVTFSSNCGKKEVQVRVR